MSDDRLITSHQKFEDIQDKALRPLSLDDFVGQEQARANLRVFIQAAKARQEAMDHVLFHGSPGLGKTTLAQIVAMELGVQFRSTSGPVISKAGDLAAILSNLRPYDVLFIDEIHRLSPAIEEILYPAMEDFKLDVLIGEGPAARSIKIDLPPFTLVGATTRSGLVTGPLRDRFGIPIRLNFYTHAELEKILKRASNLLQCSLTEEGCQEIACRSRGTPRIAGRLIRRVRDFAQVAGQSFIDHTIANEALNRLEVDKLGLDIMDRRYLSIIAENYSGGPVGVETLAAALAEQRDTIEDVIEPYLLQQGFIHRTQRGRQLVKKAYEHLNFKAPSSSPQLELLSLSLAEENVA